MYAVPTLICFPNITFSTPFELSKVIKLSLPALNAKLVAELSAISAILGYLPSNEEYQKYMEEINTMGPEVYRYLNFHEIASYKEAAENAVLPTLTIETSKP